MDKTRLDLITPYQSGDHVDGGDFTFTDTTNYDGGTFKQMDKYHHIYALNQSTIGTDDVVITGIQVEDTISSDDEYSVLFGSQGYVLNISNNPLIQSKEDATTIANTVGAKIVGMRFRPFSANMLSDPSVEAGDPCYVSIRTGRGYNTYQSFVTSLSYTVSENQNIKCDAETISRKNSTLYSAETKTIVEARKQARQEISSYDLAIQQLTNLMTNSFGVFKSEEILEDGSVIYYMHDKPTLEESQTIWKMTANTFTVSTNGGQTWNAGMDSSGNAVVNVLNAIGINAEWVRAGKLMSTNGQSYIDLDNNKFVSDNVDFTGKITATSGKISGFNIIDNRLTVSFNKTFGPFVQSDLTRVQGIVTGTITPTEADYNKYDMGGKGYLSVVDLANINKMILGVDPNPRTITYTLSLNTANMREMVKLSSTHGTTILGSGGINAQAGKFNRVDATNLVVGKWRIIVNQDTGAISTMKEAQ